MTSTARMDPEPRRQYLDVHEAGIDIFRARIIHMNATQYSVNTGLSRNTNPPSQVLPSQADSIPWLLRHNQTRHCTRLTWALIVVLNGYRA